MSRIHGRNGIVYLGRSYGAQASPLAFQSDWTIALTPARAELSPIGDGGATFLDLPPDVAGDFTGWYDDQTSQAYLSAVDGLPRTFYLYPDATKPYKFFYGQVLPDFAASSGVAAAGTAKATWSAAGQILKSPLGAAVTLLGQDGTFGVLTGTRFTPSGHTFFAQPVAGWQFGKGEGLFYSRAAPDGQVILSTVPLTENELKPTTDHAEVCVYNPAAGSFSRIVIPTSAGALTAVNPTSGLGGTDAGGGDIALVSIGGQPYILLTCEGYYFGWSIPVYGLYPALAYLAESGGTWSYDAARSLTSNQWEATNPALFGSVIQPGGQTAGNGASYWSPRSPGQMAVLPASGNVVIGHYFGTGSFTSGAISVVSPDGTLVAAYQIPNITPLSGTITTAAVRDVEADPAGSLNNEQFAVIYDAFGTGVHPTIQVFSYNQSTETISPVSVPCVPGDTAIVPQYCFFGPDGTLYVSCGQLSNGLVSANMQVYLKSGGGWNLTSQAPVFPGWESDSWPTPVAADYSLGFPVQQGLGGLAGPLAVDALTGALLAPGLSSRLGVAVPAGSAPGPNLLNALSSGFAPPNMLSADDSTFATSIGSWTSLVGTVARAASPPVVPPAGTAAGKITQPFSSGNNAAKTGTTTYAVTGNTPWQFDTYFLANTTGRTCEAWIRWTDSGGATISDGAHATATDNSSSYVKVTPSGTSPSNAAHAQLWIQVDSPANGESHFWAASALYNVSAASAGWSGFLTNLILAEISSGTWALKMSAPFSSEVLFATGPQTAVVPLQEYYASALFEAAAGTPGQQCQVEITWLTAALATISTSLCTLTVTDSASGFAQAACGALAPSTAAFATVNLLPTTTTAGQAHYARQVTLQTQPWKALPYVDYELAGVRSVFPGETVLCGRPSISGRSLYIPVAVTFGGAENAAYNAGGYVPAYKPQFLAVVDLLQVLGE